MQNCAPEAEYFPATQVAGVLEPSQTLPAVHVVHLVRVLLPPPEVNDPSPHVEHEPDFAALCSVSAPQFVHAFVPVNEYVPAAHSPFTLVPSHV